MGVLKDMRPTAGEQQAAQSAQASTQTHVSNSVSDSANQFVNRAVYLLMHDPGSARYTKSGVKNRAMVALFIANHLRVHDGRMPLTSAIGNARIQLHLPYAMVSRIVSEFVSAGLLAVDGGELTW